MIGKQISHYKITELISKGPMGTVYKAQDLTPLDRIVAIKVLESPQTGDPHLATQRFLREAQIISEIDHQNVVTLYEVVQEGSANFIVMQYVKGSTLRSWMIERKIDYSDAFRIACEVGEGLKAAHDVGIIHRDIKPENVMLAPTGTCKVLDFGVAHLVDRSTLTEKGKIIGTLPYMAPEQVRGEKVDERTDVYALGVLLYEMLCGKLPFDHEEEVALFYQIMNVSAPSLRELCPDLPEGAEQVVSKALEKDPAERYQNVADMLHDLNVIREKIRRTRISSRERLIARKSVARRPALWTGIVILLALLILVVDRLDRDAGIYEGAPRIMVMRWENTGGQEDLNWLSGAIMDGLISSLGRLEQYKIVSRQTVASVTEMLMSKAAAFSPSNAFGAAREIGAQYLVTGGYTKSNGTLYINCELSDLEEGAVVRNWSEEINDLGKELPLAIDHFAAQVGEALGANWKGGAGAGVEPARALTDSLKALKYYQIAMEYYEVGNHPAAVDNFKRAVEIDSQFAVAYLYLARHSAGWSDQEKYFLLAMQHRHASPSPIKEIIEADYLVFSGAIDEAIAKYEEILSEFPEEVSARIALAYLYINTRKFHEAVAEFAVLRTINPFDFAYYAAWWMAYVEIGRIDKARSILEQWRRRMPEEEGPLRALIAFSENQGEYKKALALCDTLAELGAGADLTYRGFLLIHLGKMKSAGDVFNQLLEVPDRFLAPGRAYSYLAYLSYKKGDYQKGIEWINHALQNERGTYNFWLAGLLAAGNGDLIGANRYAQEIKSLHADAFEDTTKPEALAHKRFYYHLKGRTALAGKNPSLAIKMYENALRYSSRTDEAFFRSSLGLALLEAREITRAVAAFERVLQLNPQLPDALFHLGRAYVLEGEYDKARSTLLNLDRLWEYADPDYMKRKELDELLEICSALR
ncbi:MAG: protein kinase [Candidatus Latescibacteria bacterium]|nr:protein kinase [Candidatus Latescibacterota bacterium]NIM21420.1 protein kinase [Candidatus Latescibacterota bacterium]NIM65601.1 protein kinase [Candidatus Latescibacterota bacterium]NIO01981.1 protein kinase [Candidatus Latescibacterota bacterium]NIO28793.1 protein kinase [Candidatus Latescibacterota bacterium]